VKLPGFVEYRVDAVVKFGGSLVVDPPVCRALVESLAALPAMGYRLMVVPGGGPTDNTIESLDQAYRFHPDTHHRACARAQDQTGLMICDPSLSDGLRPCQSLEEVRRSLDAGEVAVLLPSRLIFALDPFERTWDITSDAMAAYFAWLVRCARLLILTNVDGVYLDGAVGDQAKLVRRTAASELGSMGQTAVDGCTGPFLDAHGMTAWILNGAHPSRVLAALRGEEVLGTHVAGRVP
jgi:aspartokinase-like uncharacterized kinase